MVPVCHSSVFRLAFLGAIVLAGHSCRPSDDYPEIAQVESQLLTTINDVDVYNGGYGSGLAVAPGHPNVFYLLADRGPNIDTTKTGEKAFLVPTFVPQIGVFELKDGTLKRVRVIEFKDESGNRLAGLPNAADHHDDSIENAVDLNDAPLPRDERGIDPEGLVAVPDGTFWISDEYGPYVFHLDADGKIVERISPFTRNARGFALPLVLAQRRRNHGMEGLAITPDGSTLVGIMQSALDNPNADVRTITRTTRLMTLSLSTGAVKEFVYLREDPEFLVTDITALSANEFLVLERDDYFPGQLPKPGHKRLYRIDIRDATDVSDPENRRSGKLFDGKTLEELTQSQIDAAPIRPVSKNLVANLLNLPKGYPHDKPEGVAVLPKGVVAIANDDDFGITSDAEGLLKPKTAPGTNRREENLIYFLRLNVDQ